MFYKPWDNECITFAKDMNNSDRKAFCPARLGNKDVTASGVLWNTHALGPSSLYSSGDPDLQGAALLLMA